jgi:hypothetical protein
LPVQGERANDPRRRSARHERDSERRKSKSQTKFIVEALKSSLSLSTENNMHKPHKQVTHLLRILQLPAGGGQGVLQIQNTRRFVLWKIQLIY